MKLRYYLLTAGLLVVVIFGAFTNKALFGSLLAVLGTIFLRWNKDMTDLHMETMLRVFRMNFSAEYLMTRVGVIIFGLVLLGFGILMVYQTLAPA